MKAPTGPYRISEDTHTIIREIIEEKALAKSLRAALIDMRVYNPEVKKLVLVVGERVLRQTITTESSSGIQILLRGGFYVGCYASYLALLLETGGQVPTLKSPLVLTDYPAESPVHVRNVADAWENSLLREPYLSKITEDIAQTGSQVEALSLTLGSGAGLISFLFNDELALSN